MTAMTEEEAKKKYCPHIRWPSTEYDTYGAPVVMITGYCCASECMAWRVSESAMPEKKVLVLARPDSDFKRNPYISCAEPKGAPERGEQTWELTYRAHGPLGYCGMAGPLK